MLRWWHRWWHHRCWHLRRNWGPEGFPEKHVLVCQSAVKNSSNPRIDSGFNSISDIWGTIRTWSLWWMLWWRCGPGLMPNVPICTPGYVSKIGTTPNRREIMSLIDAEPEVTSMCTWSFWGTNDDDWSAKGHLIWKDWSIGDLRWVNSVQHTWQVLVNHKRHFLNIDAVTSNGHFPWT